MGPFLTEYDSYSGVAYAVVQPNENPEDVAVFTVRDWAGKLPGRTITNKVPTVIAFDGLDDGCPKGEGNVHWGYDIPQHLDDQTIRFVKLLLEPDVSRRISSLNDVIDPEATRGRLELLGKVAVPVAAEYVKCLWQHAKDRIIQHVGQATFDFVNKVILFTVPAVWSEKAKHNTYMIAVDAGLADHEYTLRMISEPEAAAVAVLTDRVKSLSLQEGDVYLVVDAGGGTVDLTSYRLKTKEPKLNLEEVAAGDGDVCGAVFLEMNFRKLLRTYLGTDVLDNLEQEHRDWIICAWEDSIRALFTGTDDRKYTLVTPGVPNDASVKIKGGMMTLNAAEILPIFSPVIDKIERLVRRQIKALQEKGFRPKAILLVGGLGCNKFLAKQLRSRYSSPEQIDAQCAIEVRQLDVAWESVAHGAVRCELFGCSNMVSLRIARYNVGYSYAASWQEGLYLPEQKIPDEYRGGFTANKVINWVLRRNEPMKDRATHEFSMEGLAWEDQLQAIAAAPSIEKIFWFGQSLIASPEDDAPVYPTTKTRAFATVRVPWDLAQIPFDKVPRRISPTGKPYRAIRYDVSMEQNMSGMIFRYKLQGRSVGKSVNVDFHSLPEDVDEATAYSIQ